MGQAFVNIQCLLGVGDFLIPKWRIPLVLNQILAGWHWDSVDLIVSHSQRKKAVAYVKKDLKNRSKRVKESTPTSAKHHHKDSMTRLGMAILNVSECEHQRIAKALHDGICQELAGGQVPIRL